MRGSVAQTGNKSEAYEARWEAQYLALQAFLCESRDRYPSRNAAPQSNERRLGRWMNTQRQARAGHRGYAMTERRAARLESLPGWRWRRDTASDAAGVTAPAHVVPTVAVPRTSPGREDGGAPQRKKRRTGQWRLVCHYEDGINNQCD